MPKVVGLILCFGLCSVVSADAQQDFSELSFQELLKVNVVSASKLIQSSEQAPASIVTITSRQIRRRGYVDLEELLHDLPGFDFNKGMGVNWSTIFMRGIRSDNSDRLLLIWDGIVQNDVWKQTTWISRQYPLSNVERVEVMFGPSSLLFGANAFAGIINVILKEEADVNGVSAWLGGGSFSTRFAEVNVGHEKGDWRFMANARVFSSDEMSFAGKHWVDNAGRQRPYEHDLDLMAPDFPGSDLEDVDGDGLYEVVVDGDRRPFDGRIDNATQDWFIQLGLGYKGFEFKALSWERDEAEDPWYISQKRSRTHWIPTGSAIELSWQGVVSPNIDNRSWLMMRTSGIDDDSREPSFRTRFSGDPNDPLDLNITNLGSYDFFSLFAREYRLGSQLTFDDGEVTSVVGVELTRTDNPEDYSVRSGTSDPWTHSPRHVERNLAVYGNAQGRLNERLSLVAGLRYDYNDLKGESGGFGDLLTVRAAAIFSITPDQTLKLIYGESFQAPDAWHRFATDEGVRDLTAPDLEAENLESVELAYVIVAQNRWRTRASIYLNQIENMIRLVNVPYEGGVTNKFENVGSLEVRGLEIESRYFFSHGSSFFVNATAATAKDPADHRDTGDIAPFKANVGLELLLGDHWSLYVRGHYVAARDTVNHDSDSIYSLRSVGSYFSTDCAVTYLDVLPGFDLRLSLYNVFDQTYYDPGPRSADGRSYNGAIIQEPVHGLLSLAAQF